MSAIHGRFRVFEVFEYTKRNESGRPIGPREMTGIGFYDPASGDVLFARQLIRGASIYTSWRDFMLGENINPIAVRFDDHVDRGLPGHPCEDCGMESGRVIDRGFNRCRNCGYPSQ